MQRFDYNSAKLNMSREEQAREKAQIEKDKAQSQVDAVLYQDVSRVKTGGNQSSDNPTKKNPLDTHDFVRNGSEIDKQVKVTAPEPEDIESMMEVVPSKVSSHTKHYDDEDVEDFKEHFGEVDDKNAVDVLPENFVEVAPIASTYESDNGLSPGEALLEYEQKAELERQRKEAALREQTAQSNKRNMVKSIVKSNKNVTSDSNDVPTSHLKKFPTDLAMRAKMLFPEATTMDEAVAAYMYLKEGKPSDLNVPERVKVVADTYIGETVTVKDAQDELTKELVQLKAYDRAISQKLETLELAVVYALFDHIGFRKTDQSSPGTIDFLEQGVIDMINRLEKQSHVKQMRDAQRNGRPIK